MCVCQSSLRNADFDNYFILRQRMSEDIGTVGIGKLNTLIHRGSTIYASSAQNSTDMDILEIQ